jgi:hypothetical protein
MGFLLADGYFTESRLKVTLARKDKEHLYKLSEFLGSVPVKDVVYGGYEATSLSIMHSHPMIDIRKKWRISNRKTYCPPSISWLSDEQLGFLMVGFIDGDGCVKYQTGRSDSIINIKNHASWLSILQYMSDKIHRMSGVAPTMAHINSKGFAIVSICKSETQKLLKEYANSVPHLSRKWDIINTKESKGELARRRLVKIVELLHLGVRNKEIEKLLDISSSSLSNTIRRHKLR